MSWRAPVTRGALLLMESLWVYALVAFLVAVIADGGEPSLLGAGVVVFASFGISRLLQSSDLSLGILRAWGTLLSLIVFYAVVRVDFFGDLRLWDFSWANDLVNHTEATLRDKATAVIGVPLLWVFWMRGVLRGQQHIGFDSVVLSFAVGVSIIAFVALFAEGVDDMPAGVGRGTVPYVAVGLLAVGLAHAGRAEVEYGRSFGATWLIAVGGTVLALAMFAFLFVVVDFGAIAHALGVVGKAAGEVIGTIVFYLLWPFVVAIEAVMRVVFDIIEALWGGTRPERRLVEPTPMAGDGTGDAALPDWLALALRLLLAGVIVSIIVAATAYLFTRFARRQRPGEVKESTYHEGRLSADLSDLLGSLLGRLRPRSRPAEELDPARRLYHDVLAAAEQRGVRRRADQTPLELAPRLDDTFAAETPGRITAAFDDARYGQLSPPPDDVRRLREEWEGLSKT